jgi:hypothetical protein
MRKFIYTIGFLVWLGLLLFSPLHSQGQKEITVTLVRFPQADALSDQTALLIKDVIKDFSGKVKYQVEIWGESQMAKKYGIEKYPIVLAEESIFATPEDLGFMMSPGKYAFWQKRDNQKKFKEDLKKYLSEMLGAPVSSEK